ncbi:MAG: single-stranded DNA-binding protein [Gemmatales bacterium]|nr:single-stranded DNA-binding protein [Gemmatales bacterium]MCS7161011.1 single-stranded DNA-binding protein [Gemmatales bacterium]MDW8176214.1 single-stranded DNA-binding protein [Gemmatales bacterium]MDW8221671.1 single-stranded DNA-binding protein [Gemmatales bacterium]
MANLNKVLLIGRLTRDPEVRSFASGGKVARFGFAVNRRRKNPQTGQWEDEPVYLEIEAFNRGEFGRMADQAEQFFTKGRQLYIEGHLRLDQWTGNDGQKRQRLVVVMDSFQFLDSRPDNGSTPTARPASAARPVGSVAPPPEDEPPEDPFAELPDTDPADQDIPF